MKSYPQIAMRVFNTPLLLMPDRAETIATVLAGRLGTAPLVEIDAIRPKAALLDGDPSEAEQPYTVVDGTAIIPIVGELVNRGSWLDALSGLTSYEGLAAALKQAANDPTVSGIVLDIDSPGGEAAGAMEAGALVRRVADAKPVVAYVNGMAASAANAIAAGAPKIVVAPSATVGSIGVVMLHVDRSEQMAKAGLKPTLIQKGKFKTDGSSLAPLPADAQGRIETLLDVVYGLFTSSVATHRSALTVDAVRATEAGLFIGQSAVDAGLADQVGTLEDAVRCLAPARNATPLMLGQENRTMTDVTKADHDAALLSAGSASASAERTRIAAIVGHAEAEGRAKLAQHLAFSTTMSPDAAAEVLKASAKEQVAPAADAGGLLAEMAAAGKAVVGAGPQDRTTTALSDYDKGAAEAKALLSL